MRSFYVEKGNRGLFAIQAELIDDPDGGRYASPEESLSWGRLDLWVQERNLCGPNGATWYLLPVLEWFARNWDALFHESKLPLESRDELSPWERREEATRTLPYLSDDAADRREALWYEWSLRHALRSGAEGGVFPDILLLREGECARFSWGPPPSAGMPAEPVFDHQRGDELLPLKSVCAPLFECMSELTDLMLQKGRAAAIKELPRLLSLRSRLGALGAFIS